MATAKVGDIIPTEKFHVSKLNVRFKAPFGEAEEDIQLIAQLRAGKIVQPFKARPEGEGYGVVIGRRRFLAKKHLGAKHFTVGIDCIVEKMSDEEAREASWIENLHILRKDMDPVSRGRQLADILAFSTGGLRSASRRWGIAVSTLSEWLKILELSEKMQNQLSKGKIMFKDGLTVARLKLGEVLQDELAQLAEEDYDSFRSELNRITAGKGKRGIPKGVYEIERVVWDKRNTKEMEIHTALAEAAKRKNMKTPEYIKDFLIRNIELTKD